MPVKKIRQSVFMTLEDMAQELGVSVQSVWSWEQGKTPSLKNRKKLVELCKKYGVNCNNF